MTLAVALPNWVGDAVMATPALRALAARFRGEGIVGIARPSVRQVLDPSPWISGFIEVDRSLGGLLRAASALRPEACTVGVLFPNSFRSALLLSLGGVARRVGYDRGCRGFLLTERLRPEREGGRFVPTPQITYYLRLAELLGAPTDDRRMALSTTEADETSAAAAYKALGLDAGRTLLLCPGASFGPSKQWPAEHWAVMAEGARRRFSLQPAVLCGPNEAADATAISEAGETCPSFHDRGVTLGSARAVVRQAKAMVAIDSGLRHYAAAFDRPVVSLFGPTHIRWTETWHPKEVRLQAGVSCGPCQKPVCPTGTNECMRCIEPGEVLDALGEALDRDAP